MDALEHPFVLCVRVGTWVERRDHAWSIASVYTGLCPCFFCLFVCLLVSGQPCFTSVPTLRLCICHAQKTSWMCTAHKLSLSVHSAVIQNVHMVCFHHTKAVKLTSWLSLTRPVQHHFLWCWPWWMRVMYSWGMPVPRSFLRLENQLLASMCLGYLLCYPEVGEWFCQFIGLKASICAWKISVLNCCLRAVQCCLPVLVHISRPRSYWHRGGYCILLQRSGKHHSWVIIFLLLLYFRY